MGQRHPGVDAPSVNPDLRDGRNALRPEVARLVEAAPAGDSASVAP